MNRFAFVFALKPGALQEYEARHQRIWPEMLDLLASVGIDDYSIYSYGDLLVGVLKSTDPWPVVQDKLGQSSVQARWNDEMADLIDWQLDESGGLREVREVFRFDQGTQT
jgi:L-rhamnose mutarotase